MSFDHNLLLYGDNLAFLTDQDIFPSESIDLIYLDPPFKSDATYNVLFKEVGGESSAAQIKAFDDTWSWDQSASESLARLMHDPHASAEVQTLVKTLHGFLGHSPMLAYLVQMAVRLVHLRRVLRPTGSLYLHCDPTASHYLKLVLDGIFGPENFKNEIVWLRSKNPKGSQHGINRYSPYTDSLLYFTKSDAAELNLEEVRRPLTALEINEKYSCEDEHGRYADGPVLRSDSMGVRPNLVYKYNGFTPGPAGWRMELGQLKALDKRGDLAWTKTGGPRRKLRPDNDKGEPVGSFWGDIAPINSQAQERLGYPTQKPLPLLKRVVLASSKPGDVVLDPFCGCGTTIDAVETLNREHPDQPARRWVGIDITHLAINLIKSRLTRFDPPAAYEVRGEPTDLSGARALFAQDPYQFQFWACGLVGARPRGSGGGKTGKKGADQGIDGSRFFVDDNKGPKTILVQVKGGKTGAKDIRDFRGVIERESAALGIFITMQDSTRPMREEAASLVPYQVEPSSPAVPRLQIVTIEQLLSGGTPTQPAGVTLPRGVDSAVIDKTFKKAKRHEAPSLFAKREE